MTALTLVRRNIMRNWVRSLLTLLATGVSLFLLTFVLTVVAELDRVSRETQTHPRVAVHHKASFAAPLPEAYLEKLRKVAGVKEVVGQTFYGGLARDESFQFASLATDPEAWPKVFHDFAPGPREQECFRRERIGCLIGEALALRFGWKVGDRLTLRGTLHPVNLEFQVCGILRDIPNPSAFFFQRRYFREAVGDVGVNVYWLLVDSVEEIPRVAAAVDAMFANSPAETMSESEKSLFSTFVGSQEHIIRLIELVGLMVVLITMAVAGNTMGMSVRERSTELAVLKCLGFTSRWILRTVLLESVLLSGAGGLLGAGGAYVWCARWGLSVGFGPLSKFEVELSQVGAGIVVAVVIGLLAGGIPAWMAARSRPALAMRRLA